MAVLYVARRCVWLCFRWEEREKKSIKNGEFRQAV